MRSPARRLAEPLEASYPNFSPVGRLALVQDGLASAAEQLTTLPTGDDAPARRPFDAAWLQPTAPRTWCWDWPHLQRIRVALNAVADGTIKRLIIQVHPRIGKSEMTTVRFPVYWLQHEPTDRVILGAYSQKLANRFSRRARRVAAGRLHLSKERNAVEEWETTEGGGMRAVGVGAGVTGHGGNLILVDDPVRSRAEAESAAYRESVWDWFTDDLYTRLEPEGAIVLQMARWHEDDLAGRILASASASEWTVVSLPALAERDDPLGRAPGQALCPARYDEAALADIRKVLGSYAFAGLYQQRPAPSEGGIFKRQSWRYWQPVGVALPPVPIKLPDGGVVLIPAIPLPDKFDQQAQSWDMTFTGSADAAYVTGGAWARLGARAFLLDQVREKMDFPATVDAVRRFSRRHPATTAKWVENKANGPAIIATLRREIPGLIGVEPEGDKVARAHAVSAYVEAGGVFLPHPAIAPWVWDFIEEHAAFPNGAYADQVDQTTQALRRLLGRPGRDTSPWPHISY